MIVVNIMDADKLLRTYIVHHQTKTDASFQDDWEVAVETIKRTHSEVTWGLREIVDKLKVGGWTFYEPPTAIIKVET